MICVNPDARPVSRRSTQAPAVTEKERKVKQRRLEDMDLPAITRKLEAFLQDSEKENEKTPDTGSSGVVRPEVTKAFGALYEQVLKDAPKVRHYDEAGAKGNEDKLPQAQDEYKTLMGRLEQVINLLKTHRVYLRKAADVEWYYVVKIVEELREKVRKYEGYLFIVNGGSYLQNPSPAPLQYRKTLGRMSRDVILGTLCDETRQRLIGNFRKNQEPTDENIKAAEKLYITKAVKEYEKQMKQYANLVAPSWDPPSGFDSSLLKLE